MSKQRLIPLVVTSASGFLGNIARISKSCVDHVDQAQHAKVVGALTPFII